MSPIDYVRNAFPDSWPKLAAERSTDRLLDEICTDFERLSADIERAHNGTWEMSEGLMTDAVNSVEGLKLEIEEWLRKTSNAGDAG